MFIICKAWEKEKANSVTAALPLTFVKIGYKYYKYNILHNISISSDVKLHDYLIKSSREI